MNKKVYIYVVQQGRKGVKKVSLSKLISNLNLELYTKTIFINKKKAIKYNEQIKRILDQKYGL